MPYRILSFYSGGRIHAVMTRQTRDDPRHRHEVRPGAITYAGSYVVDESLTISRDDRSGFREILERLRPATRGTCWERAIRERLAAGR